MTASCAPTARAAATTPSSTRCGASVSRIVSLTLAGSPSVPLATTMGGRRVARASGRRPADGLELRARREAGAAPTPQPGPVHRVHEPARVVGMGEHERPEAVEVIAEAGRGGRGDQPRERGGRQPRRAASRGDARHARRRCSRVLLAGRGGRLVQQLRRRPRPPCPSGVQRTGRRPREHRERDDDRGDERGEPQRSSIGPARGDPPPRTPEDDRHAGDVHELHPAVRRVRAGTETVHERDRPRGPRRPCTVRQTARLRCRRSRLVTITAIRRSTATAPNPSQIGRYGERKGTTASSQPIGAKPSTTVLAMWTPRNATASSERLRCRPSVMNLGQRGELHPFQVKTPSATVPVSRTSATRPVPRVRYQSACPDIAASPPLRGRRDPRPRMSSSAGHPPTVTTSPERRTRRAGSPARPASSAPTPRAGWPRWTPCWRPRRSPRPRSPCARPRSAGRPVRGSIRWCSSSPPRCQRRRTMLDVARPPPSMTTDGPGPSVGASCSSASRTTQPPSDGPATAMSPPRLTSTPVPAAGGRGRRGAVGAPGLGRRSQVELDAFRHGDRPRRAVDADRSPTGRARHDRDQRRALTCDELEVTVVAEHLEHAPDRRIDEAVGRGRRGERHLDRVEQGVRRRPRGDRRPGSPPRARCRHGTCCRRGRRPRPRPPPPRWRPRGRAPP